MMDDETKLIMKTLKIQTWKEGPGDIKKEGLDYVCSWMWWPHTVNRRYFR